MQIVSLFCQYQPTSEEASYILQLEQGINDALGVSDSFDVVDLYDFLEEEPSGGPITETATGSTTTRPTTRPTIGTPITRPTIGTPITKPTIGTPITSTRPTFQPTEIFFPQPIRRLPRQTLSSEY